MTHLQHSVVPKFSLRLLGGFAVAGADGSAPVLAYAKLRALFACLAIERGNELSRSWLAGLLWPELDEGAARQNLRRALSNLRSALDDEEGEHSLFRISRSCIGLNSAAPIDIDVADILEPPPACVAPGAADQAHCRDCLSRMERVVARYRGELLPGFALPDNPEFEQWLSAQRETIHRHALLLLDRLAACHAARGNPERALPFGLRRLDLDPWDEVALRRVMGIYVAGGQSAAALAQFNAFRRELESELGVLPDQETLRLAAEIGPLATRLPVPEGGGALPERRQLTVVCCQISPFDDGDSDEAIERLPALRQHCETLLREQGGHTLFAHGGVLAYFGYPKADERATLRAVGAALAVAGAPVFSGVSWRVGVHTGLVLSDADSGEIDVAGNTSGIALAVPLLIAAGTVALTLPTYRLVARHFDCESLGSWRLGGEQRLLGLFRVLAPTDSRRWPALRNDLAPFVGRDGEFWRLAAAWQQALVGDRQLLLVGGEAGIGKSRLAQAHAERLIGEGAQVVELSCQSESSQEALQPLLTTLLRHLSEASGDPAQRLDALARALFPDDGERVVALGNWLLDVHGDTGREADTAGDDGRRRRMLNLLLDLVDRQSQCRPLLILVEDLHWADPSTLDLIGLFRARTGAARVMLLATARPQFVVPAGWQCLPLASMPEGAATAMVEALAAERPLPENLVRRVVDFSDGVPLFLEEMTRMLLTDVAGNAGAGLPTTIPHTLRDLLASRLDALDEAKPLAQHAAVLGRRFTVEEVAWMMALPEADVELLLSRMEAAGLASRCGAGGQFRHALIREAAYQSLPPTKRKALHRRAAEMLRQCRPRPAVPQPGLIAHHYAEAGVVGEALEFHRLAADLALRYSAYREHVWHLRQALAQLAKSRPSSPTPEAPAGAALEVQLLVQLGWAVGEIEGLGSANAREIYNRAFELCRHSEGDADLFKTVLGLWRGSSSWSGYAKSLALGEQLLSMAEKAADPYRIALACYTLGNVHCALGNLDTSIGYSRRAIASYRPEMPASVYGDSAGVGAHSFLGWAHTLRAGFAAGLQESRAAVDLARTLAHPPALCFALIFAAETHRLRREPQAVVACAAEAAAVANACGIVSWTVFAEAFLGWGEALAGKREGLQRARHALDQVMGSIMAGTAAPLFALVAEAALRLGEHAEGLHAVGEALALMDRNHGRHLQADLLLLRCEFLQALGRDDEARASAVAALGIACEQGGRLFELRAATALLRMIGHDRGQLSQVLARLRELLGVSEHEDDPPCLHEARSLLAMQGG